MITVKGYITLKMPYNVQLNISRDKLELMPSDELERYLDDSIDWHKELDRSEFVDIIVTELE